VLNQVVLVGKLNSINNDSISLLSGDVLINDILCGDSIINNVKEYCKKSDIIGVKGKIITDNKIQADRITFLSSRKGN
jgi:hypothetical protein